MKRKIQLITLLAWIMLKSVYAQGTAVTVTGSAGAANGSYSTLKAAFDALNLETTQAGNNITIAISASTTETASATLNAPSVSVWSSLKIYPTADGLSVSGTVNDAPLIYLNGVDSVTIDGRVNATGSTASLTISNASITNTANSSTICLANDACVNTIQYCTIKGSSTASLNGAVIYFGGTTGSIGNDNNIITKNNITAAVDANRPVCTISSSGTGAMENSNNTISSNNIYNFLSRGGAFTSTNGIVLAAGSIAWTITDNSFYETAAFVPTYATAHYIITLNTGSGHTISNNYIGGSAAQCSGTWTKSNAFGNTFYGIYLMNCGSGNNIQGNTIKGFSYSNPTTVTMTAIYLTGNAGANIGTTSANTIGASTGTGSITLTTSSPGQGAQLIGINNASAYPVVIKNNIIGSFTTAATTASADIIGIRSSGSGIVTISGNTIGSTSTANSIYASAASALIAQSVTGIYTVSGYATINNNTVANLNNGCTSSGVATTAQVVGINAGNAAVTVWGNNIYSLSIACANNSTTNTASVVGILVYTTTTSNPVISGNLIHDLTNNYSSATGAVMGIYYAASTSPDGSVRGNFIYNLSIPAASVNGKIYGINSMNSSAAFSNNIISLGGSGTVNPVIYDMFLTSTNGKQYKVYYNSLYIYGLGNPATGNASYALYVDGVVGTRDIRNNIFYNARSTPSIINKHYAAYFNGFTSATGTTLDYNDYFVVPGLGGVLGYFNAANVRALPMFTGLDANSGAINPSFASAGGTSASDYYPSATVTGTPISVLNWDYNESVRGASSTKMGALESALGSSTVDVYSGGVLQSGYVNLRAAFDKINDGTHTGDLVLKINGSQALSAPAILYGSGINSANYSSVNIYPTVSGISITGNTPSALIDLNGADNVTIDGRVNASGSAKDMVIINTNYSSANGTATVRLLNGASYNTIKYCTLKGSSTNASNAGGIIYFANTSTTTGNNNNLINNNDLTCSQDTLRVSTPIVSLGLATGYENKNNTVSNNNIYNFAQRGASTVSSGILLGNYNSDWTITGNSIYETNTFIPTGAGFTINGIYISYLSGTVGFVVSNNYFGGSSPQCGSLGSVSAWTKTNAFSGKFTGIAVSSSVCSIQGNTVKNIDWSDPLSPISYGLYVSCNNADISGNIIGSPTGNNSIKYTTSASSGKFFAIYSTSVNGVPQINIANNSIGSITLNNQASDCSTNFYGIYYTGGTDPAKTIITNNLIGSTDALTNNSIISAGTSTANSQSVLGIYLMGACTLTGNTVSKLSNGTTGNVGTIKGILCTPSSGQAMIITNNTVRDIKIQNTSLSTGSNSSAAGMSLGNSSSLANMTSSMLTVSGNTVYNIMNTNPAYTGPVYGISYDNKTLSSTVSGNKIYGISGRGQVAGLFLDGGDALFANNMISVGGDTGSVIMGICDTTYTGSASKFCFNTVSINPGASSTTGNSYALYRATTTATSEYVNNIFSNTRALNSSSGKHYAAFMNCTDTTGLKMNYNDYYVSGTDGVLGYFNGVGVNSLPIAPGLNANSVMKAVNFTSSTDLHLSGSSNGDFSLTCKAVSGVTVDFDGETRSVDFPYMGADEATVALPVELTSFTGKVVKDKVYLKWQTATEVNCSGYQVERTSTSSKDTTAKWKSVGFVKGAGNSNSPKLYTFTDPDALSGKAQYRLKMLDNNGEYAYSSEIEVSVMPTEYSLLQNYPNPFNPSTKIKYTLPEASSVKIEVYNSLGQKVCDLVNEKKEAGYHEADWNASQYASGMYIYRLSAGKYNSTKKMMLIK